MMKTLNQLITLARRVSMILACGAFAPALDSELVGSPTIPAVASVTD
jgi:hypothetical protein